jgi:integrase
MKKSSGRKGDAREKTSKRKGGERQKTTYPGVYYVNTTDPSDRKKADKIYGIVYYKDGRKIEEGVGRLHRDNMNPSKANAIRSDRIRGIKPSNQERRGKGENSPWTFDQLWKAWKEDPDTKKKALQKAELRYRKHIAPRFGHREPSSITSDEINIFIRSLAKNYARETTKSVLALVRRVERYGLKKGVCKGLPFLLSLDGWDYLGRPPQKKAVLQEDQVEPYIRACREWPNPQEGNFMLLQRFNGIRRGSARNLKWDDVDLDNRILYLRDSKTGDIEIPMTPQAKKLLHNHRKLHRDPENPYVFQGGDKGDKEGNPPGRLTRKRRDRAPAEILKAAGLKRDSEQGILDPCHMHRRGLATMGDKLDLTLKQVMDLGGWKSPAMVNLYTKTTKKDLQEAAARIGKALEGEKNTA